MQYLKCVCTYHDNIIYRETFIREIEKDIKDKESEQWSLLIRFLVQFIYLQKRVITYKIHSPHFIRLQFGNSKSEQSA